MLRLFVTYLEIRIVVGSPAAVVTAMAATWIVAVVGVVIVAVPFGSPAVVEVGHAVVVNRAARSLKTKDKNKRFTNVAMYNLIKNF